MWQYLIIAVVAVGAGWFLLRRWRRTFNPSQFAGCGCGNESNCEALQQSLDSGPGRCPPDCAENRPKPS